VLDVSLDSPDHERLEHAVRLEQQGLVDVVAVCRRNIEAGVKPSSVEWSACDVMM
jgi:hypothetical protein